MRIILEGCDGTGKTTLAKIIADKYKLDICHCSNKDPGDYDFYNQTVRKNNIVWDRHTIGELIYPEIFDRKPRIYQEDARLVLFHAKELEAKIFVLTADVEEIRRRLMERGNESPKVLENIELINERFLFYADLFGIPVINTSELTFSDIFKLIKKEN